MDKEEQFLKLINDFIKTGIDKYKFNNEEEIVITISGLRGLREYVLAKQLYEKYESVLQYSDIYPVALTNIIEVCNDCTDIPSLIRYAKELKLIASDHPYVINLSKTYNI